MGYAVATWNGGESSHHNVAHVICTLMITKKKFTTNYHLTPVGMACTKKQEITNVDEDVEKREPSCFVGWPCKLVQLLWKTVWRCLKIFITVSYDPAFFFIHSTGTPFRILDLFPMHITPSNSRTPVGCLRTQLWGNLPGGSTRFPRVRFLFSRLPSTPTPEPSCLAHAIILCFPPNRLWLEVPTTSPLGLPKLLGCLRSSGNTFTSSTKSTYHRHTTARWTHTYGKVPNKAASILQVLGAWHGGLCRRPGFPSMEALIEKQKLRERCAFLMGFSEGFTAESWLTKSLAIADSASSPHPFPILPWGLEAEKFPPSNHKPGAPGNQPLPWARAPKPLH